MIAKYRGWALQAEYALRAADNTKFLSDPILETYVVTGDGINAQLSYCLRSFWEIAGRYSRYNPGKELAGFQSKTDVFTLGLNKYIKKHKSKAQLNFSYNRNTIQKSLSNDSWNIIFQVEMGI